MTASLAGRVALVTGAGRGIGRAIARRLSDEGAAVVVNDLDAAACAEAVAAIPDAVAAPGDVADPEAAPVIVDAVARRYGRLDVLVNNAGITRDALVHRMSDEDWHAVRAVALDGTFHMCRAAAELLRGSREHPPDHHRKVVNVSSSVAIYGAPGTANYAAAKAGVIGLTRSLAREWARYRINVNAVAPGLIAGTRMTRDKPAELVQHVAAQVPLGRAGTPDDVAGAVAFLCSTDADFMTGQVLELHGGLEVPG
jgi:3-oxoacyl-[acyl-carrier protein] reductase